MTETTFATVSDWMPNGSINEFVKTCQDANPFELVGSQFEPCSPHLPLTITRFPSLTDVAGGLIRMHGQGMIHGDLKGVCSKVEPYHSFSLNYPLGQHPS